MTAQQHIKKTKVRTVTVSNAEKTEYGWTRIIVPAGTRVLLGNGMVGTVSQAALDCDCGKGVYCPYVTQERAGIGSV